MISTSVGTGGIAGEAIALARERLLSWRIAVRPGVLLIAALALGAGAWACEDEPRQVLGTAPSEETLTPAGIALARRSDAAAAPTTSAPGVAGPTGGPAKSAKDAAAPTAGPGKSAKEAATPAKGATPDATCGDKPLPPCPLAAWMKANAAPAITTENYDALADVLDKTVTFAPDGYPNWASIARDGAAAARAGSLDAVKASCRSCHKQYRQTYRAQLRSRPIL